MRSGATIKKTAQKMLFCFVNISAEILLHILGCSFCTECHIFADVVAIKSIKNFQHLIYFIAPKGNLNVE
jgi:hypothetical protein